MKKMKFKFLSFISVFVILFIVVGFTVVQVDADNECPESNLTNYGLSFPTTEAENKEVLSTGKIVIKARGKGTYSLAVRRVSGGRTFDETYSVSGSDSVTINLPDGDFVEVTAKITDDGMANCKVDGISTYTYDREKQVPTEFANPLYNSTTCGNIRSYYNGLPANKDKSMLQSFGDFCNSSSIIGELLYTKESDLKKDYESTKTVYESIVNTVVNGSTYEDVMNLTKDYLGIKNTAVDYKTVGTAKSLVCDVWGSYDATNNPYVTVDGDTTETYLKTNTKVYSAVKEDVKYYADFDGNASAYTCKTTCSERIVVSYDKPTAIKAGLCFQYKVKVSSTFLCNSQFIGDYPTHKSVCSITPACHTSSEKWYTQAGPSDEFDSCVTSCDGGKYSQKCINKCYKKVYGTTRKMSLPLEYSEATVSNLDSTSSTGTVKKLAQDCGSYDYECIRNNVLAMGYTYNDVAGYTVNNKTNYSRYSGNYNNVRWGGANSDYYWARYSSYYFSNLNIAGRTVNNEGIYHDAKGWSDANGYYYAAHTSGNYYPGDGFKRATNCSDNCYWEVTGCSAGDYLSKSAEEKDYVERVNKYNAAKASCESKAVCKKTTDTYEIKTYVDRKGNKNDKWYTWTDTDDSKIIIDQGGDCFGKDGTYYKYMTELTYPGSWINNKTGEVTYKKPSNENAYTYKNDSFCAPLDQSNVNTLWWYWVVNMKRSNNITAEQKKAVENQIGVNNTKEDNTNLNIRAKIKNFGYFGWSFDISCFYAVNNNDVPACPGDTDTCPFPPELCEGDSCDKTEETGLNYKFRSIDSNSMFPSGKIGYNWTDEATNTNNANYQVTPVELADAIKERQSSLYNNDAKYLDYHIQLTPENIRAIKSYNKAQGNYTKYGTNTDATFKETYTNVKSYYSDFLRNGSYTNLLASGTIGCNNQLTSGSNSSCETFK